MLNFEKSGKKIHVSDFAENFENKAKKAVTKKKVKTARRVACSATWPQNYLFYWQRTKSTAALKLWD